MAALALLEREEVQAALADLEAFVHSRMERGLPFSELDLFPAGARAYSLDPPDHLRYLDIQRCLRKLGLVVSVQRDSAGEPIIVRRLDRDHNPGAVRLSYPQVLTPLPQWVQIEIDPRRSDEAIVAGIKSLLQDVVRPYQSEFESDSLPSRQRSGSNLLRDVRMAHDYESGLTIDDLVTRYGCSKSTVSRALAAGAIALGIGHPQRGSLRPAQCSLCNDTSKCTKSSQEGCYWKFVLDDVNAGRDSAAASEMHENTIYKLRDRYKDTFPS